MDYSEPSDSASEGAYDASLAPAFYSIQQTRRVLNLGKTKVFQLLSQGQIEFAKVGRWTLVLKSSVDAFIEKSLVNRQLAGVSDGNEAV